MRSQARFRTTLFRPLGDDDDQHDNGRELAQWLCARLPADGLPAAAAEDWGWRIDFDAPALHEVFLGCGQVEVDQWSVFCEAEAGASADALERVVRELDRLLATTPEIADVEWFENDARHREFNHGPRAFGPASPEATPRIETPPAPRSMRGMDRWLAAANGIVLAGLAAYAAFVPGAIAVLALQATPLALALLAARVPARLGVRGLALAANVLWGLGCAVVLLYAVAALARGRMDPAIAARVVALFAPVLALCVLNLRALVGPSPGDGG